MQAKVINNKVAVIIDGSRRGMSMMISSGHAFEKQLEATQVELGVFPFNGTFNGPTTLSRKGSSVDAHGCDWDPMTWEGLVRRHRATPRRVKPQCRTISKANLGPLS